MSIEGQILIKQQVFHVWLANENRFENSGKLWIIFREHESFSGSHSPTNCAFQDVAYASLWSLR